MAAEDKDLNPDPITGEPGSHPVGTGIGAAGGAVAGAAAGAIGGPIGMAVGGVVGAVVGGLAGKAAAEAIDPTAEEAHWRDNYDREPYYEPGRKYDDYGPAYRLGVTGRQQYDDWDSAEPRLASEWESARGGSSLSWDQAKPASRAAWHRVDSITGGEGYDATSMGSTGMGTGARMDTGTQSQSTYDQNQSMGGMSQSPGGQSMGGSFGGTSATAASGSLAGRPSGSGGAMGSDSSRTGSMDSDPDRRASIGGSSVGGSSIDDRSSRGSGSSYNDATGGGAAAAVGSMQAAGDNSGDRDDVIDVLQDLAECSLDGEYGFRECAERADRQDLKTTFLQRADECRRAAQELNEQIRALGGSVEEHGSAAAAVHRGWVSVKSAFTSNDDKAVLEECERGEDNAKARYAKALQKPLPAGVKLLVERQYQGVQRNHDQIKMLRDQFRAQS